jgi:hypothetical protein
MIQSAREGDTVAPSARRRAFSGQPFAVTTLTTGISDRWAAAARDWPGAVNHGELRARAAAAAAVTTLTDRRIRAASEPTHDLPSSGAEFRSKTSAKIVDASFVPRHGMARQFSY